MDAATILIMRRWLVRYCEVMPGDILYDLYVHVEADVRSAQEFWLSKLDIEPGRLRTYFKKPNPLPIRRNVGREYHGIMRMQVRKSSSLNRRVAGWIEALKVHCGVV